MSQKFKNPTVQPFILSALFTGAVAYLALKASIPLIEAAAGTDAAESSLTIARIGPVLSTSVAMSHVVSMVRGARQASPETKAATLLGTGLVTIGMLSAVMSDVTLTDFIKPDKARTNEITVSEVYNQSGPTYADLVVYYDPQVRAFVTEVSGSLGLGNPRP